MTHPLAPPLILVVGALSLFLAVMGLRAWLRARDARLLFVTGAFGLFGLKNLVVSVSLWMEGAGSGSFIRHTTLELMGAAFDLVVVLLLAAPFLRRRR